MIMELQTMESGTCIHVNLSTICYFYLSEENEIRIAFDLSRMEMTCMNRIDKKGIKDYDKLVYLMKNLQSG